MNTRPSSLRAFVRVHAVCLLALAVVFAGAGRAGATPAFTIAVLPDTQGYSNNRTGDSAPVFGAQTGWIADNAGGQGIVFVTHLGDVVNNAGAVGGAPTVQWDVAVPAMETIRTSGVPYSILPGNHDWTSTSGTGSLEHYRVRFGDASSFFAGQPWFLGFDRRGVNSAQLFDTPIGPMLHIALEFNAASPAVSADRPGETRSPLQWAQAMINAHPGVPTIISTHDNINGRGARNAEGNSLYETLVVPNDQVFLVLNGHFFNPYDERAIITMNGSGRVVFEMLADYQGRERGGDGWMRLLTFEPDNRRIVVKTYTPLSDAALGEPAGPAYGGVGRVETDGDSAFELAIDFAERFKPLAAIEPAPAEPETELIVLAEGREGYAGTVDTEVRRASPTGVLGDRGYMHIDTNEGGDAPAWPSHGLLRFGGVMDAIGADAGRAAVGATLRLYVHEDRSSSDGSGFEVRRMRTAWDGQTTWNAPELSAAPGLGGDAGIGEFGSDGFEALAAADDAAGGPVADPIVPSGAWVELDVTRSVRAVQSGAADFGWLLQAFAQTTNATRVESSETELSGARVPELVIRRATRRSVAKTFTSGADVLLDESSPTSNRSAAATLPIDGGVDNASPSSADAHVLLGFDGVFGPGGIAPGASIASAVLCINVDATTQYHPGGGFTVHRVLRPWGEADTWASLDGGLSADNAEAAALPDDRAGAQLNHAPWDRSLVQAGTLHLDVTESLRRWSAAAGEGQDRAYGWVLRPMSQSTNATVIDSFEAPTADRRPRLVVHVLVCDADVDGSGVVDLNDYFEFLGRFFAQLDVADPRPGTADIDGSGVVDLNDYFAFLGALLTTLGPCR